MAATAGLGRRPRRESGTRAGLERLPAGIGDRDGDGDVDDDGDVDKDRDRDKDEDGDGDGAGNAVTSPPPSLQVAKAGEGFVASPRDFGDGAVGGQVRGSSLNLPPSGWGIPGTVFPPRDLLAPVALLS